MKNNKAIIKTIRVGNDQELYEVYLNGEGNMQFLGSSRDYTKARFLTELHNKYQRNKNLSLKKALQPGHTATVSTYDAEAQA